MRVVNPVRLVGSIAIGLSLAAAVGFVTAGTASGRSNPAVAYDIFPGNCDAAARVAFADFQASVTDPLDLAEPAREALPLAREALRCGPLLPKAYGIAVAASNDSETGAQLLAGAAGLDRRDLFLQGLVLQGHLARRDAAATTETLDDILRVHPAREAEFFPSLANAMTQFGGVDELASMLDGSAPWHSRFLDYAVGQPAALTELANLYPHLNQISDTFEQRLVQNLGAAGNLEEAWNVYRRALMRKERSSAPSDWKWGTAFPPFDWAYTSAPGRRVQPSLDMKSLEIMINRGQGGVLAVRTVRAPQGPAVVSLDHNLEPAYSDNFRVLVECAGGSQTLLDQSLTGTPAKWTIARRPPGCSFLVLKLYGRALATDSRITGQIEGLTLRGA